MAQLSKNYFWIPTVYTMQGLPFALVTILSPVLYKNFGFSNTGIAFITSLFILPWIFKFFLAPALEKLASKRTFVLVTQFSIACFSLLLSLVVYFSVTYYLTAIVFFLIAFAAALHDINSDGLYLEALTFQQQASLIGIRTVFYQIGKLFCQGGIIFFVGYFMTDVNKHGIWSLAFLIIFVCVALLFFINYKIIPVKIDFVKAGFQSVYENVLNSYQEVLQEFRQLPSLVSAIVFVFLYHVPEFQINKIFPLFMLDEASHGGLALSVSDVGIIYGIIGLSSMLLGVTLSGFFLTRFTLKKCLVPFSVLVAIVNLSYWMLQSSFQNSLATVGWCIAIVEFAFGMANGAYMLYLITMFAKGKYSMSLYAIATAIMLLSVMLSGSISGYLQALWGYSGFFIWIAMSSFAMVILAYYQVRKVL